MNDINQICNIFLKLAKKSEDDVAVEEGVEDYDEGSSSLSGEPELIKLQNAINLVNETFDNKIELFKFQVHNKVKEISNKLNAAKKEIEKIKNESDDTAINIYEQYVSKNTIFQESNLFLSKMNMAGFFGAFGVENALFRPIPNSPKVQFNLLNIRPIYYYLNDIFDKYTSLAHIEIGTSFGRVDHYYGRIRLNLDDINIIGDVISLTNDLVKYSEYIKHILDDYIEEFFKADGLPYFIYDSVRDTFEMLVRVYENLSRTPVLENTKALLIEPLHINSQRGFYSPAILTSKNAPANIDKHLETIANIYKKISDEIPKEIRSCFGLDWGPNMAEPVDTAPSNKVFNNIVKTLNFKYYFMKSLAENEYLKYKDTLISYLKKEYGTGEVIPKSAYLGLWQSSNPEAALIEFRENFNKNYNRYKDLFLAMLAEAGINRNTAKLILRKSDEINVIYISTSSENKYFITLLKCLKDKDANFILKILKYVNNNIPPGLYSSIDIPYIVDCLGEEFSKFTTIENFNKKITNILEINTAIHNNTYNMTYDQLHSTIVNIFKIINKHNINIDDNIITACLNIVLNTENRRIMSLNEGDGAHYKEIINTCSKLKINLESLQNDYKMIKELFFEGKIHGSHNVPADLKQKIYSLQTSLEMIKSSETLLKYIDVAEPKNEKIFKLNYKIDDHLYFKVLGDLDIKHFDMGNQTDCCQRLGGAGEAAAIDSFVNGLAGVLVLYYDHDIISQSYFHYVPSDNGIILDNVEENAKNKTKHNIDLDDMYALLAQKAAKDMGLAYFRCGISYNKLNKDSFDSGSLKNDPREFSVEDPYTDFHPDDNLDLLKPTFPILEGALQHMTPIAINRTAARIFIFKLLHG